MVRLMAYEPSALAALIRASRARDHIIAPLGVA